MVQDVCSLLRFVHNICIEDHLKKGMEIVNAQQCYTLHLHTKRTSTIFSVLHGFVVDFNRRDKHLQVTCHLSLSQYSTGTVMTTQVLDGFGLIAVSTIIICDSPEDLFAGDWNNAFVCTVANH